VVNQNQELYLQTHNSTHAPILAEISFKTFKQHSFQRQIRNYNAVDIEGLFADDTSLFVVVERLVIHRSIQVPVSVVKCVASNTTFSKFKRFNIFLK
jgi:hypothetical protein